MADYKNLVRAFSEAWAERDLDRVMTFFADDCVYAASIGPEPGTLFVGQEAVRIGIESLFEYDSGSRVEAGRIFAEGSTVFSEWTYRFPDETGMPPAHGCDVFDFDGSKIIRKDAFRKQLAPALAQATEQARGTSEVYRPRRFDDLGVWTFGSKRFKLIGVSRHTDRQPFVAVSETLGAAKAFANKLIPEMDRLGRHFDLGFAILHEGEAANWLLFDWWIEGGILCQILCSSSLQHPTLFARVERPLMACAWELVAIEHERRAWAETMMSDCPAPDTYLSTRIQPGLR